MCVIMTNFLPICPTAAAIRRPLGSLGFVLSVLGPPTKRRLQFLLLCKIFKICKF